MNRVKTVLLLSGPMGSGHIRAAEVLREYFAAHFPEIRTFSVETSIWMPRFVRWIFVGLYPLILRFAPSLWRHIHHHNNHSDHGIFPAILRWTSRRTARRILEEIENVSADLVISTHFYPGAILADMRRRNFLHVPVMVVVTDHTAHRIYAQPGLDMIFVPNELSENRFLAWGIPTEKICVSGCPVGEVFGRPVTETERIAWRKEFKLDEKRPYLLLTFGSWCLEDMDSVIRRLLRIHRDFGVLALTGQNHALYRHLQSAERRSQGRLRVFPYTPEICKLMAISEYVITKPGGITTLECIALGKPMLLINPIPGHEEKNQKYLVERGVAIAVGAGETLADAVSRMCTECDRIVENMQRFTPRVADASEKIVKCALHCAASAPEVEMRVAPEMLPRRKKGLVRMALFCAAFLAGISSGCTPVLTENLECHIITSDGSGHPVFYDRVDDEGNLLREGDSFSLDEHLAGMAESLAQSKRKKVMIYCFGGMNSADETVAVSAENIPVIMRDDPDVWPIFVNWESELFDCYANHLLLVRNGMENYWTGPVSVPFYFMSDLFTTLMALPLNIAQQTSALWESAEQDEYNQLSRILALRDNHVQCYLGGDYAKHRLMPLVRLGYFAGTPVRFFTTSLIDVFGSRAWEEMRRRSCLCFVRDPRENPIDADAADLTKILPDGVFSRFAEMLIGYMEKHPDTEITLIGHSMGSFIVTEILARYPQLPVKNIVFMAAASSVRETAQVVRPYLAAHREAHFYNLCLHPFIDRCDMMDYCVLPCGSILTWVDQFLTSPGSKEDYTVGEWNASFLQLPRLMRGVESQVTIKGFGILDRTTNTISPEIPSQHTDFSSLDAKFWRPEVWQIPPVKK